MKTRYLLGLPFAIISINNQEIEVIIDTGFNGALSLPQTLINELQLKRIGSAQYIMADGTLSDSSIYLAEIDWFNEKKEVSVISSSSEFGLLGMELLSGVKTILDPANKTLTIEPSQFPKLL
tara:strand:- start:87 stop:452 length:366 start_codon:yes stop_codon:yes gene_type:complete